jgi:hypothetical protein
MLCGCHHMNFSILKGLLKVEEAIGLNPIIVGE